MITCSHYEADTNWSSYWKESRGVSNVQTHPPDQTEREDLVFHKLGSRGGVRFCHFRDYYSAGWGGRGGKPLSPRALELFFRFLEQAQFTRNMLPSLFLTDSGTLELCWEDALGKAIQVEFTSAGIEYYLESTGTEGCAEPRQAAEIAARLTAR